MASGCGRDCELSSLGKAHEKRDAAPSELRKAGGKFKINNKASSRFLHCPVTSSLKETQDLLLVSFIKRVTKVNEFAILYNVTISDSSLRYCES